MNVGFALVILGLLALVCAAAWLAGPFGLVGGGVMLVGVGVGVDWEKV